VSPAKALEQLGPLVGDRVALVVLALGEAEHGELLGVPAGDDVQPEAPGRDVVGRGGELGHHDGVRERHVDRREGLDAPR
jgi:hypothetical protein